MARGCHYCQAQGTEEQAWRAEPGRRRLPGSCTNCGVVPRAARKRRNYPSLSVLPPAVTHLDATCQGSTGDAAQGTGQAAKHTNGSAGNKQNDLSMKEQTHP